MARDTPRPLRWRRTGRRVQPRKTSQATTRLTMQISRLSSVPSLTGTRSSTLCQLKSMRSSGANLGRKVEQNLVEAKVLETQRTQGEERLARAKTEKAKTARAKAKRENATNATGRITSHSSAQCARVEWPPEAQRGFRRARGSRPGIQARGSGMAGIRCLRVPGVSGGHRRRAKEIQALR